jgi:hypothetical protein
MRRREFTATLGGLAAVPFAAHAQQSLPAIGFLGSDSAELYRDFLASLRPSRRQVTSNARTLRSNIVRRRAKRPPARARIDARRPTSDRDRCINGAGGAGIEGGEHEHSDRFLRGGRSDRARARRKSEPARRQSHRHDDLDS